MTATIGLILYTVLIAVIGYAFGKFSIEDDLEYYKRQCRNAEIDYQAIKDWCDVLRKDNREFMKRVPKTELKKELIVSLHNKGMSAKQIGKIVSIKKSTINAALRKWGYGKK